MLGAWPATMSTNNGKHNKGLDEAHKDEGQEMAVTGYTQQQLSDFLQNGGHLLSRSTLLQAHYRAPDRTMTASQLAQAAGYAFV